MKPLDTCFKLSKTNPAGSDLCLFFASLGQILQTPGACRILSTTCLPPLPRPRESFWDSPWAGRAGKHSTGQGHGGASVAPGAETGSPDGRYLRSTPPPLPAAGRSRQPQPCRRGAGSRSSGPPRGSPARGTALRRAPPPAASSRRPPSPREAV